jgi:hypothetical protein
MVVLLSARKEAITWMANFYMAILTQPHKTHTEHVTVTDYSQMSHF